MVESRYKKNLKNLHVAHPSWLMKVMTWFLQVFISPKFFNKVRVRTCAVELEQPQHAEALQIAQSDECATQLTVTVD